MTYDQGYRCQWCEHPCSIEENQRGACDECVAAYDAAHPAVETAGEWQAVVDEARAA
ncbi:MAG TPA: hypothetical protein VIC82_03615 [Candidatus Nanopelagicales bacterium]